MTKNKSKIILFLFCLSSVSKTMIFRLERLEQTSLRRELISKVSGKIETIKCLGLDELHSRVRENWGIKLLNSQLLPLRNDGEGKRFYRTGERQIQYKFSVRENSKFCSYRSASLTSIPVQNYRMNYSNGWVFKQYKTRACKFLQRIVVFTKTQDRLIKIKLYQTSLILFGKVNYYYYEELMFLQHLFDVRL